MTTGPAFPKGIGAPATRALTPRVTPSSANWPALERDSSLG